MLLGTLIAAATIPALAQAAPGAAAPQDPTATEVGCDYSVEAWRGASFTGTQYYGDRSFATTFHLRDDGIANWRIGELGTTGHDRYELRKYEGPNGTDTQIYFVSDEGRGWGPMHTFTLTADKCAAGKVVSASAKSEMRPVTNAPYVASTKQSEPLKRTN
jgi:hypothetical protein